jgi:exodeoxyribonuclease VIII
MPKEINPGKYPDMSNENYHGHTDSISRSAIMDFAVSPRKYWANYLNPRKPVKKSTQQMIFGEQFHMMILEPERFEKEFSVQPNYYGLPRVGLLKDLGREEYNRQKAERSIVEELNKQILEEWSASNLSKRSLDSNDYAHLCAMRDSLQANEEAWNLITEAKYEQSYFWEDDDTGLLCKARPDILHGSMVVDLKTTKDASPRAFQSAMCNFGYHIQAAMILDAVRAVDKREIVTFINIAVEKEYPYSVGVYIIDSAAIASGREKYKRILKELKQARESNVWTDYESQIIGLPAWYNN